MHLPRGVKNIISRLGECGFEAYAVGGCVRDSLLGREIYDYDLCTNAKAQDIINCFGEDFTIPTGIKHGTVTVKSDGMTVEVTTFRIDGTYSDSRHPDEVVFTSSLEEDLARRDFTMNAVAFNEKTGFIDPFSGTEDIKNGIIRCVGDADRRFSEDALRILRGVRFSCQLGFDIEENTRKSIHKNARLVQQVSAERIFAEFSKILCARYCLPSLTEFRDVVACFIPEIAASFDLDQKTPYHDKTVYDHSVCAVDCAPTDLSVRLAAFLHDIGKPHCFTEDPSGRRHFKGHAQVSHDMAEDILARLKVSNKLRDEVLFLILHHDTFIPPEKAELLKAAYRHTPERLLSLFDLQKADALSRAPEYIDLRRRNAILCRQTLEQALKGGECYTLKQLAISGGDLIKVFRFDDKRRIAALLEELLFSVIDNKTPNTKTALLNKAKQLLFHNMYEISI